ncbi:15925_t:CDS:2 [Dentiscutata erythropus]|uniref:15925_t:CDS:1 n=1 Tax=Dentiscutata erythropus TaxID=1348616 RepID=A0A9N9D0T7_9GLOM|nr:15925_t:CDS:2 [Dentiscutata erythropus]
MANNLESGDSLVPTSLLRVKLNNFDLTPRQSLSFNNTQSTAALKKQQQDQLNKNTILSDLSTALSKQQLEKQSDKKFDYNKVSQELKVKLTDFEKDCDDILAKSAKVSLGSKKGPNVKLGSQNISAPMTPAVETSSASTTTSSRKPPSRRERNVVKGRQKDVEFATEIGQGLLLEVRRLQALLKEKEERIGELDSEKVELERNIEQLNKTLHTNQESEDRLNERVWTLELTNHDLSTKLEDLQQQLNKARNDYTKIEKALSTATDVIEQFKDKEEKLASNLENFKSLYDMKKKDMENNRKILLQEKDERIKDLDSKKVELELWNLELTNQGLSSQLEDSQQQLNKARNDYSNIEKALATATDVIEQLKDKEEILTSDLENLKSLYGKDTENNIEDLKSQLDSFLNDSTSNDVFHDENIQLIKISNKNLNVETMKALDVANRMISSLRTSLKKERDENHKLKMLLVDSQEFEVMHNVECFDTAPKQVKTIQGGSSKTSELSDISKSDMLHNDIEGNKNNDIVEWEMI